MKKHLVHGQIKASLLALIFVTFWSLKTVHTLFQHHTHRHDVPLCEAASQGQSKHLHDERYHPADCSICAFTLAIPELVSPPALPKTPETIEQRSLLSPARLLFAASTATVRLRGPPVH